MAMEKWKERVRGCQHRNHTSSHNKKERNNKKQILFFFSFFSKPNFLFLSLPNPHIFIPNPNNPNSLHSKKSPFGWKWVCDWDQNQIGLSHEDHHTQQRWCHPHTSTSQSIIPLPLRMCPFSLISFPHIQLHTTIFISHQTQTKTKKTKNISL